MGPDESTRIKAKASLIGYSENQLIVESAMGLLDLADDRSNSLPRLVVLIRAADDLKKTPKYASALTGPEKQVLCWFNS